MAKQELPVVPLVERYLSIRLDTNLSCVAPGETVVVETPRRLTREASYSFVRTAWYLSLIDGRRVLSIPPGAGPAVREWLDGIAYDELPDNTKIEELRRMIDRVLLEAGHPATDRVFSDMIFACNRDSLIRHPDTDYHCLTDTSIQPADGLDLPEHCFPDGLVYGVVDDDRVVSVAFAHRTLVMEDRIVDVGIVTAPDYRRRGYARTVLSALTSHIIDGGGEGYYCCNPENTASIHTARSVGYTPYGSSVMLAAPCVE